MSGGLSGRSPRAWTSCLPKDSSPPQGRGLLSVLGFEGSDYYAAIFGSALDAERVEIWTDVDGIRTTDPRFIGSTRKIDVISYEEAAEMAVMGAKVLHPLTIEPARKRNIPIRVLNSTNRSAKGRLLSGVTRLLAGLSPWLSEARSCS